MTCIFFYLKKYKITEEIEIAALTTIFSWCTAIKNVNSLYWFMAPFSVALKGKVKYFCMWNNKQEEEVGGVFISLLVKKVLIIFLQEGPTNQPIGCSCCYNFSKIRPSGPQYLTMCETLCKYVCACVCGCIDNTLQTRTHKRTYIPTNMHPSHRNIHTQVTTPW